MNELPTVLGIVPFIPVAIFCYWVGAGCKAIKNENLDKFIPEIVVIVGGLVTTLLYCTINGYIPAQNWFDAFVLGMVSGSVSVCINQIYKQFTKEDTYDGIFEGEVPNEKFDEPEKHNEDEDPKDETKEEE